MSQHDFDIANQSASSARVDINNALKALASLSSGATEPSTTYANMPWYETSTNTLKMRSEADDAWISLFYLNQSTDTLALFDDTQVVDSSGTQTGLLGDQATSVWEAGTGTTESLVSPAKVKSAIEALAPDPVGVGQTWQELRRSRSIGVSYQNTTGKPIQVSIATNDGEYYVSSDNVTYVFAGRSASGQTYNWNVIIPSGHYYKVTGAVSVFVWAELR